MEKINLKNFEDIGYNEDNNIKKNNNIIDNRIQKVKEIDLISSFNDSGFFIDNCNGNNNNNENENNFNNVINNIYNDDDYLNKNNIFEKKDGEIKMINRIKENNILVRENEELKNKLKIISNNSQKLLKILGNSQTKKQRFL
jgi:hypothetical protein